MLYLCRSIDLSVSLVIYHHVSIYVRVFMCEYVWNLTFRTFLKIPKPFAVFTCDLPLLSAIFADDKGTLPLPIH